MSNYLKQIYSSDVSWCCMMKEEDRKDKSILTIHVLCFITVGCFYPHRAGRSRTAWSAPRHLLLSGSPQVHL